MITVIVLTGIHSNVHEMSTSEQQLTVNGSETAGIVAAVDALIATVESVPAARRAIDEGREVSSIVESLGLPGEIIAASRLCPLLREQVIDEKTIKNNKLDDISKVVSDLVQLGHFSLPASWKPGEALGGRQSEALRKMLLAVVSDARLVLVRIAEQLYRLRQAKDAPPQEQRALALETREIYAALANRLGVWQLKWELEDLSFRYLDPETYLQIATALREKRN